MPVPYIDSLDDPLVYDQQASFVGGQVSYPASSEIGTQQAWRLMDCDIEYNGVIRTRFGFHALGNLLAAPASGVQGFHFFSTPTLQVLLVVASGVLWKGDADGLWTEVDGLAFEDDAQPAYFAQLGVGIYISTGGKPKYWDATSIGTPAPGVEVTDGPAKAIYLVAHQYRLFAFDADSSDQVYASTVLPTGATPFTFAEAEPDVEIAPFRVGEGEGDPVTAMVSWKGPNLVVFKADSSWLVNTTTTGAASTFTADFAIGRISGRVGCIAHRSAAAAGNDLLFMARDGVRSLARTEADGDGAVSQALTDPILDVMERRNLLTLWKAAGVSWGGKYLVAFPSENSTDNDTVAVVTLRTMAWQLWQGLQPEQFCISAFAGQNQRLCLLDRRTHVAQYRDYVPLNYRVDTDYQDRIDVDDDLNFVPVSPKWLIRTRSMNFSELLNSKSIRNVELVFDRSQAIITVRAILDEDLDTGDVIWSLDHYNTGGAQVVLTEIPPGPVIPFTLGGARMSRKRADLTWLDSCHSVAFEIQEAFPLSVLEQLNTGPIGLRRITVTAWLNAMETRA